MKLDTCHAGFLEDGFRYASEEVRTRLADAFYSLLRDAGRTLELNTAESDAVWVAKQLCPEFPTLSDADQLRWEELAFNVLDLIPTYQMRVAERLIQMAKVAGEIASAERKRHKRAEQAVKEVDDVGLGPF